MINISSLFFRTKARSCSSIILRGANDFMRDEMERSVHDALCVVKRVLESKSVVPGGGAVEAALSIYLENFATSLVSSKLLRNLLKWRIGEIVIPIQLARLSFIQSKNEYIHWETKTLDYKLSLTCELNFHVI